MTRNISQEKLYVHNDFVVPLLLIFMSTCILIAAFFAATHELPYAPNPILMKYITGYVGLPFSLGLIFYNLYRLIKKRNALFIDINGITDYTTWLSSGFIPWHNVKEVYLLKLCKDEFLCVVPVNLDDWYLHLSSGQRRLARANADMGFAPIRIQLKENKEGLSAKDAMTFCRALYPKKVTKTRKL